MTNDPNKNYMDARCTCRESNNKLFSIHPDCSKIIKEQQAKLRASLACCIYACSEPISFIPLERAWRNYKSDSIPCEHFERDDWGFCYTCEAYVSLFAL